MDKHGYNNEHLCCYCTKAKENKIEFETWQIMLFIIPVVSMFLTIIYLEIPSKYNKLYNPYTHNQCYTFACDDLTIAVNPGIQSN